MELRRSAQLLAEAKRFAPGGVHSGGRRLDPPLCIREGRGARLIDVDGNEYIDFHGAYGAILLGHAHEAVDEAVAIAARRGVLFGVGTTEDEVELARRITELVSSVDLVLLTTTGTDAISNAIRLARAVTGRERIVKFQGSYNGSHDAVLQNWLTPPDRLGRRDPGSAGILESTAGRTLILRFNDEAEARTTFAAHGEHIAAVIVEPILHSAGSIVADTAWLAHLRALCDHFGALLILDEVVTAFRHHQGGYQAIAGVTPDLTAMGKALANGYQIAALGGRGEFMQRFSTAGGDVFWGSTHNSNRIGVAAALATLDEIGARPVLAHIAELGDRMRDGLRQLTADLDVSTYVSGYGSVYQLLFLYAPNGLRSYDDVAGADVAMGVRYRRELLARGVFEMWERSGRCHISASHTREDIDRALDIAGEALKAVTSR